MSTDFIQQQIEALLKEASEALRRSDWLAVREKAQDVLAFDPQNANAEALLGAAERRLATKEPLTPASGPTESKSRAGESSAQPTSFANGRYTVTKFLGEGGKKKVYLARDSRLDRDVAFALVKTEGLDEASRVRVQREAEAMGRLGAHPHIVTVFDIGEENGQPYLVLPVLAGGDVEGLIEKAPENKLTIERAVKIALDTSLGLEFAHSKGIVHRDLKPGNVWLTEDGRAMIGDFGLAVAVDKSRLTQAGMMVGTVSYMPPEQAMGGEVGPRSDLYSLGAMLYEMVCGRPPFVGDESVAIIGQHLNTPPVAPSWHRPDCPPALETLILRLLEKDPSKRPASATEVREALESVSPSRIQTPRDPSIAAAALTAGDNPLYRRTFVGREPEVKQLQAAFDAALSGQGGLVMVVGEPGIGKTAICEQLATYVALRGGKALVGHCYEEGSLSLPYLAFVEAMRSYVLAREPDGLRSDLGTGAADVARIVSEVRDRVQGVELRAAGDPEDDRWRLLQAITSFLRNASTVQPLCIVLEDLHWADRGTLDLLLHVARNLSGARLLIIGNYRDVEVDRAHPLSGVLADLRRINSFASVRLRGLTVDEVHRMYESVRGQAVPWGQAEAVFRATEGNPLFVQEVLRYLVEEGVVVREGGRYVAQQGEGVGIPEGLRDVVGKRLNRLGEKTNQVLSIAAVIGRDFRLDVLQAVANLPEEEVIQALEEATERAVVEQHQGFGGQLSFRFTHAFFRQTLYEELFAARRIRMHQQVARALEGAYGRRVEEHAAELAEHYANSSDPTDLAKSVHYSEVAAQRALTVYAYGEAVRHLDQALKAQEVLDPDDKARRCDLLLLLAEALPPAGNPERALTSVAPESFALAEEVADSERALRACRAAIRSGVTFLGLEFGASDTGRRRVGHLDHHARPGTVSRVQADLLLGALLREEGNAGRAWRKIVEAFQAAKQVGDADSLMSMARSVAISPAAPVAEIGIRRDAAMTIYEGNFEGVAAIELGEGLWAAAAAFLNWGERDKAEELLKRLESLAERIRHPVIRVNLNLGRAHLAIWDGALGRTLALADEMVERGQAEGREAGARAEAGRARRRALFYLGRSEDVVSTLPLPDDFWTLGGALASQRAIYLAHAGHTAQATEIIDRFLSERDFTDPAITSSAGLLRFLLEAAVAAKHQKAASILEPRLAPIADLLFTQPDITNCMGRDLGGAALLLGQPEKARVYYQQGIEACTRGRHRPELALTRLEMAELLLEHYPDERDAAIEHLDFAIAELRDMKMQPALERALRHRGLLKA